MYFWTLKRVLTWVVAGAFVGFIVFYAYFQSRGVIGGPEIKLVEPQNDITATTSLVAVYGTVTHAKELVLDGRAIFIDTHGNFYEQLLLSPGYNIIELTARDGEGRETRKTLELVYDNTSAVGESVMTSTSTHATSTTQ